VAAAVGGMIDTVVDGVTGLHVAPRDPDRLASALGSLLADEDQRRAFGRAGAQRARRLYDWARIGAATLDVYRNVGRGRSGRAHMRRFGQRSGARDHVAALQRSLDDFGPALAHIDRWGEQLASALLSGQRLLVAGNGGSAAEAQHLTAELVGRYENERDPLSAICLHAETSSLTAICNDYGACEAFARQVRAHGRPGDVLLALSTSGHSENVLAAVAAAHEVGLTSWALTGRGPNPLADAADEAVCAPATHTATVQELHLVGVHLLCEAIERRIAANPSSAATHAWGATS
jgi:type III pantothenate kinase